MIDILAFFFVSMLVVHWFADFVCQTHWQAINKSKRWDALSKHVLSYTIVFGLGLIGTFAFFAGQLFSLAMLLHWQNFAIVIVANGVLHFITDAVTSRWSSYLWKQQKIHDFFVVIGFDQVIHQLTIFLTLAWLVLTMS